MVGKKILVGCLLGLVCVFFVITVAGYAVKIKCAGRVAPGIVLCGREVSGMTVSEVQTVVQGILPEITTEVYCPFLSEQRAEIEKAVQRMSENEVHKLRGNNGWSGTSQEKVEITAQENKLCLRTEQPMLRILQEDTVAAVLAASSEVKVWEWLYAKITGTPFRIRKTEAVIAWEEEYFAEMIAHIRNIVERDCKEAAIQWKNGKVTVAESERGFRLETERVWADAEAAAEQALQYLQKGPAEGMVLRFYLDGTALMPRLSTAQAEECNTIIGAFTTAYDGAGNGRAKNIAAGAKHLHKKVILPGETFSTAAALMPFTEENGYAAGGTYIDGQLSESIGGGVCQLSTTLYNALLQTRLLITERYPHSMPVGYIPLGQDAAIAGDYKDLKFQNNTDAPVLLLCEAEDGEVRVTLYGAKEAARGDVLLESNIIEETEANVTVEVYRTEQAEGGATWRERISRDKYRYRETEKPSRIYE